MKNADVSVIVPFYNNINTLYRAITSIYNQTLLPKEIIVVDDCSFKAEGDKFQNLSQIAVTESDVAKLENQVSNYTIRNGMYIVTASQDGQIVQANKSGIGEILKEVKKLS